MLGRHNASLRVLVRRKPSDSVQQSQLSQQLHQPKSPTVSAAEVPSLWIGNIAKMSNAVLNATLKYISIWRDHIRIEQRIPEKLISVPEIPGKAKIIAFLVLNGLHYDYRRAA